jgi:hypothetical protein
MVMVVIIIIIIIIIIFGNAATFEQQPYLEDSARFHPVITFWILLE